MQVAILATHPIQYQVPWFQGLASREEIDLRVYFAMLPNEEQQGIGFNIPFAWDIPMLEGYEWEVIPNARETPTLNGFRGSSIPAVRTTFAQSRPDAVILTGWHSLPMLQGLGACITLGIPRLVRGEANAMRKRPWAARMAHRALLSRFDAALAIGKSSSDFYRQNGMPDKRIFLTRYFVDNARFSTQAERIAEQRPELRTGWNIPVGATCYLYVGKLEEKKRILDLLLALEQSCRTNRGVYLLVVGTGDLMQQAKAIVAERNLPVTFAGFLNQSEISRAYVAADCLVLPSDYGETWGLVVNEAMASGRPAIVSDRVGCGPDLIEDGVTGAVFPFGDITALARRLAELANPRMLAAMGRVAQQKVARYSVAEAVDGTVQALDFVSRRATYGDAVPRR